MTTTIFADTSSRTVRVFWVEWKGKSVLMVYDGCCGPMCPNGEHQLVEWACDGEMDAILWCEKCDSYGDLT